MRIDKFLNAVNITKRRAISEDMCRSGVVSINDIVVKASKEVKINDIISLNLNSGVKKYKVLAIPSVKNIAKSEQDKYVESL